MIGTWPSLFRCPLWNSEQPECSNRRECRRQPMFGWIYCPEFQRQSRTCFSAAFRCSPELLRRRARRLNRSKEAECLYGSTGHRAGGSLHRHFAGILNRKFGRRSHTTRCRVPFGRECRQRVEPLLSFPEGIWGGVVQTADWGAKPTQRFITVPDDFGRTGEYW
jgi:hypothetical protein